MVNDDVWLAVHVRPPETVGSSDHPQAELLGQALFELGAAGLEWREGPLEVIAAFPAVGSDDLAHRVRHGLESADVAAEVTEIRTYEPVDWSIHWRRLFKPLDFGPLWVVPSWLEVPPQASTALRMDPSSAFGTGIHPTTALCLEWLVEARPNRLLDVGTGTGILGLAAIKLGARQVLATDNDTEALRVADENRSRNAIDSARFELSDRPVCAIEALFEAVVANILAGPLINLAAALSARVEPGGLLTLSGVLGSQVEVVREAYEGSGLVYESRATREEWARLTLRRPF